MALTSARLTNGGVTAHYKFQYDDSLSSPINPAGPEPARTNAVIAACENDFNLMSGWFGNIALDVNFTIPVNVTQNSGGAAWGTSGRNLTVTINPGNGSANFVRYLLVSEMVEQFMRAQNKGWFGSGTEGSQGEGLSRFLGAQFLASNGFGNPPVGFTNSNLWLTTSRDDYVNNINPTDDGPTAITGCSLLFIYYLFSQLGFSISAIVAAGASPLAGVYRNLTGDTGDPFPFFKQLLDRTSTITTGNLDNPFPLIDPRIAVSSGCAVARASDHLDVFWAAPDGSVWSNWWDAFANSGGWNLPFVIAPAGNAEPETITCVARTRDHLDVFWVARDGSVWSNWYDAFANSGRWNLPFVIAPAGSAEPGTITCRGPDSRSSRCLLGSSRRLCVEQLVRRLRQQRPVEPAIRDCSCRQCGTWNDHRRGPDSRSSRCLLGSSRRLCVEQLVRRLRQQRAMEPAVRDCSCRQCGTWNDHRRGPDSRSSRCLLGSSRWLCVEQLVRRLRQQRSVEPAIRDCSCR